MSDFSESNFMKKEIAKAEATLDKSLEIAHSLFANLPKDSEIRTTAILIGAGFELVFDVVLEFRFRTNRFSNEFMIKKKREIVASEGILNEMYDSDLKQILEIRNHCAHSISVDKKFIKMKLHGTKTYQRNKKLMKGMTLGEELRQVSLLIHNTFRIQFAHYVTEYLNKLEGWE